MLRHPVGITANIPAALVPRPPPWASLNRTLLLGTELAGIKAQGDVEKDDDKLFYNRHANKKRNAAVDNVEVGVVQKDGQSGVDKPHQDEGCGNQNTETDAGLLLRYK